MSHCRCFKWLDFLIVDSIENYLRVKPVFMWKFADKKDSREHSSEICALHYIEQTTTLAVGFKNGTFQLWDINSLKKLFVLLSHNSKLATGVERSYIFSIFSGTNRRA